MTGAGDVDIREIVTYWWIWAGVQVSGSAWRGAHMHRELCGGL